MIVVDYFAMLANDVVGRPYSKAEHSHTSLDHDRVRLTRS